MLIENMSNIFCIYPTTVTLIVGKGFSSFPLLFLGQKRQAFKCEKDMKLLRNKKKVCEIV